jgi:hypothetical protein
MGSIEDFKRRNCKALQEMWTDHGKRPCVYSECTEEVERKHNFSKISDESEKAQPIEFTER